MSSTGQSDRLAIAVAKHCSEYLNTAPTPNGDSRRAVAHCLQAIKGQGVCMLAFEHEGSHKPYDRRIRIDRRSGGEDRREG